MVALESDEEDAWESLRFNKRGRSFARFFTVNSPGDLFINVGRIVRWFLFTRFAFGHHNSASVEDGFQFHQINIPICSSTRCASRY